jgi:DNA-binding NtrC family response regulator
MEFTEDAILKLQRCVFPGNVRELEHIIERAVVRAGGRAITSNFLVVEEVEAAEMTNANELEKLLNLPYRESVQAWERLLIGKALKKTNGNKAEAARLLGIHRRLLYEKLDFEAT